MSDVWTWVDIERQNQQGVDREPGDTTDQTLDRLRDVVARTIGPLGPAHAYVPETVELSLRY